MLEAVSQQAGAGRLPQWMSTHPDPENRQAWAPNAVASLTEDLSRLAVNRPEYLRRLDGMMFGENPREGFFQEALFRHPDMAFRMDFPQGWKSSNQKQAVGAMSPKQDAVVVLQLAPAPNAQQAAQKFFSQQGIEAGEPWRRQIGGFPAVSSTFRVQTEEGSCLAWWHGSTTGSACSRFSDTRRKRAGTSTTTDWSIDRQFQPGDRSGRADVQPRRLTIVELTGRRRSKRCFATTRQR